MATMICLICLRTDITAVSISTELACFVDDLCDYNIIENPRYKYCTICVHLLKKFYNFKQRCLKACKILKSLKGKHKFLPKDLHEQIPSSIGLCNSLPPYKLLEHQHNSDADLFDTKSDLNSEPNITSNDGEVHSKQNLETADPTLQNHIEVKDEPMHDILDSNVKILQAADSRNLYIITVSDGNLILRSNFEEEIKSIKLDKEEFNTDKRSKNCPNDNTKPSKISNYLKSFEKEIKDDDISDHSDDMIVKDSTFILNNDPLRDDESLTSMDDVESNISDCDVNSINMDEQNKSNTESESDTDSLIEFFKNDKDKKLEVSKIYDLELAKMLLKIDKKNKVLKNRVKFLKDKAKIKTDLLKLFENDEYNLGDGVKISKEVFLKIYERCEKISSCNHNLKDTSDKKKTDDFLRTLLKMYNPEYETVFDIEYLDTEEKKLQEFNRRKDSAEYQNAPYQCSRCYKGFHLERLRASHMKNHDESSGPHECHICSLRFPTARRQRAHANNCHSAVYVCRLCHVTFYYFLTMKNHYDTHKGVEYRCPQCDGIFRTYSAFASHKRIHVTSHICTTCAKSFVSAKGLQLHRGYKHKDAPSPSEAVRCSECLLTLDSQKVYERHLKISHRTERYTCVCFKKFSSMADLRKHKVEEGHQRCENIKTPTIPPYMKRKSGAGKSTGTSGKSKGTAGKSKAALRTCPICQEQVLNSHGSSLYYHFTEQHPGVPYRGEGVRPRDLLCEECGQAFAHWSQLVDHKNTHLGLRPFSCHLCPARFPSRHLRSAHLLQHRAPLAPCELCGKTFKSWPNRFAHMRGHANIRCFKCKICGAGFAHPATMREHVRGVHFGQRRVRPTRPRPPGQRGQRGTAGGLVGTGKRAARGAPVERVRRGERRNEEAGPSLSARGQGAQPTES